MKSISISKELLLTIILCIVSSCTKDISGLITEDLHSVRLCVDASINRYDDLTTRAASSDWDEGDVLFLLNSVIKGKATYKNGEWELTYSGNITQEMDCKICFIDGCSSDVEEINLNSNDAIYFDSSARLKKSGDYLLLQGVLKPKAARVRFNDDRLESVKVEGFSFYSTFSPSSMSFETEKNTGCELKFTSGYTPYIYIAFDNTTNQEITLTSDEAIFKRTLTSTHLANGKSGYFTVPTINKLEGWTFVSEIPIEPWDGTVATSFAGGSGTYMDPYQIETGAQLAYLQNAKSDNYYVLMQNIDLNNLPWKPLSDFRGNLDGNGMIIKNLKVTRKETGVGLFSSIGSSGKVSNVTIQGVQVGDYEYGNVGAIAGENNGKISGCKVLLTPGSYIKGNDYVGGIVGHNADDDYSKESELNNCSVISSTDENVILGNENVGGITGSTFTYYNDYDGLTISDCFVNANISGSINVGGIVGRGGTHLFVERCKYEGTLSAQSNVGGIMGYGAERYSTSPCPSISSCCARVNVNVKEDNAGGIRGNGYSTIISCYSDGSITAPSTANYIGGIGGLLAWESYAYTYCSYSTVISSSPNFCGLGYVNIYKTSSKCFDCVTVWNNLGSGNHKNCYTNAQGNDIVDYLKSSGSEYTSNWNFNSTWTWTGQVDGKNITVTCPKLTWEK